ncbi:HD-GYP domain-containing protein [Helicovermis profundi]|uniref:HD-GYP domain-containing protein n=1 Tax=Helicovermis profundi TaxID=3065157 RepID=A0AAU9EE31_9FIRM|nr:HD-GYP domain-containing protein [Clostridia bacterium S502]
MRLLSTSKVKIGQFVGRPIFSENGNLLLGKGVKLTKGLIDKIFEHDIYFIYIDDEISKGIEINNVVDEEHMAKFVTSMKKVMDDAIFGDKNKNVSGFVPLETFKIVQDLVKALIENIMSNKDVLYSVTELMGTDMYTYKHSVNVAILSILTSKSLKYNYKMIEQIAIGALLHDIGKINVKNELINKKEPLTDDEFDEIKNHAKYGFEIVKKDVALSAYVKQIIIKHHEKLDGSGYPSGIESKDIPEFVRIVTLCDIFDAITNDRVYRKRIPMYKALEILMTDAVFKLDRNIYRHFVENICIYPPGSGVKLSDNREAIVVKYRREYPSRPLVRIIDKDDLKKSYDLDLIDERTIFVENVIELDF